MYFPTIGSLKLHPQTGFADWDEDFPNPGDFYLLLDKNSIQPTNNQNFSQVNDPKIQNANVTQLDSLVPIPAAQLPEFATEWQSLTSTRRRRPTKSSSATRRPEVRIDPDRLQLHGPAVLRLGLDPRCHQVTAKRPAEGARSPLRLPPPRHPMAHRARPTSAIASQASIAMRLVPRSGSPAAPASARTGSPGGGCAATGWRSRSAACSC